MSIKKILKIILWWRRRPFQDAMCEVRKSTECFKKEDINRDKSIAGAVSAIVNSLKSKNLL
jgi:hypothetical protein